jgi:hypothetical protein
LSRLLAKRRRIEIQFYRREPQFWFRYAAYGGYSTDELLPPCEVIGS